MEFNKASIFKWWYAKDATDYKKLLEEKTANIVAMTRDGRIIRKMAPLTIENEQLAVADCGTEGRFYLTPNQWVSPQKTETLTGYWLMEKLSREINASAVLGVYQTIDDNMAVLLPKDGAELFGKPSHSKDREIAHYIINAIVPIGDGKCIAYGEKDNTCTFLSDRETEENTIKVFLDRINR